MTEAESVSLPAIKDATAILERLRSAHVRRPVDDVLTMAIDTAIVRTMREPEARGVVVTGLSGAGKSTMLRRLIRKHPRLGTEPNAECRIISVSAPGACTLKELGRKVCWAAGYPIQTASEAGVIWDKARQACRAARVRFLHLDEVQNVTATVRKGEDTKMRDTLKSLLIDPEWKIGLILSGQPDVVRFIEADQQVSRRMGFVSIGRLPSHDPSLLHGVLKQFAFELGLDLDPALAMWLAPRMAHAALGQLGTAVENLLQVLEMALDDNAGLGRLTAEHFASEYAARTGNAAFANPYLTSDWEALDCSRRNVTGPDHVVDEEPETTRRKRQGRGR